MIKRQIQQLTQRLFLGWYKLKIWMEGNYVVVPLSGNHLILVRKLGLFELDNKGNDILPPYRYQILMATGQILEDEYNLDAIKEPPKPPDIPAEDIEPNSWEFAQLREYETYLAAIAHEKERIKSYEARIESVAKYILDHCVSKDDQQYIVEVQDWQLVYQAALTPGLTEEDIADTLRNTFQGVIWEFGDFSSIGKSDTKRERKGNRNPTMGT